MSFTLNAACGCNMGKVRSNNEDNFFFGGKYLEEINEGLPEILTVSEKLKKDTYFAVFDGMGGENYGETAAYTAAKRMSILAGLRRGALMSAEYHFSGMATVLNEAVVAAAKEKQTDYMGATMVGLCFSGKKAAVCNLGDSRAYMLRERKLEQLSIDHVSSRALRPGGKAPLTQNLGIEPDVILVDPYTRSVSVREGDTFLLCSDGLTDMVSDDEILSILTENRDPAVCVDRLITAALENGGRDNITVIVCRAC